MIAMGDANYSAPSLEALSAAALALMTRCAQTAMHYLAAHNH